MRIVQTDTIPLKRGLEHRGGIFHGRIIVEGEPDRLDNFQVSYNEQAGRNVAGGAATCGNHRSEIDGIVCATAASGGPAITWVEPFQGSTAVSTGRDDALAITRRSAAIAAPNVRRHSPRSTRTM